MNNVLIALDVLEAVGREQPIGVSNLARELDLPKSTVQRSLETLRTAGWIRQSSNGAWSLTLKPAVVGQRAGNEWGVRDAAQPVMTALREDTGESIRLWLRDGSRAVLVQSLESTKAVRAITPVGVSLPAHASSAGKAMLAALPAEERDAILGAPLESLTSQTITDPAKLRRALEQVRKVGYAVSSSEAHADVHGVAAAILAPDGRPAAALGIVVPAQRSTAKTVAQFGGLVRDAAAVVSARLRQQ
jgi:DNA-binding IclR family transcriptional regulator